MSKESAYEKLYKDLIGDLEEMHRNNIRRTGAALKSLLIVPTIFLILLFLTNSSKTIFLVLWIVSMFIIASVLIVIEYQDYKLQKMFKKTADNELAVGAAGDPAPADSPNRERIEEIRRSIRSRIPAAQAVPEDAESEEKPSDTPEKSETTVKV